MQDKPGLIYRSILVILFIVFLAILYGYSENGRYAYFHKEIIDKDSQLGWKTSVVDTRTGTIYEHCRYLFFPSNEVFDRFSKEKLTTAKFFVAKAGGNYEEIFDVPPPVFWKQVFIKPPERVRHGRAILTSPDAPGDTVGAR